MQPPQLHIDFTARDIASASTFSSSSSFEVEYLNNSAVDSEFWKAWEVCMGLFMALAGGCALMRWYKWVVRPAFEMSATTYMWLHERMLAAHVCYHDCRCFISGQAAAPWLQERRRNFNTGDDFTSILKAVGEATFCGGLALAAVALVLSLHSFVLFKAQAASFLYAIQNDDLERFRTTVICAAVLLGWAVVDVIYQQTQIADIAMVDWERPQQVLLLSFSHAFLCSGSSMLVTVCLALLQVTTMSMMAIMGSFFSPCTESKALRF
jgi:hypothetical protein